MIHTINKTNKQKTPSQLLLSWAEGLGFCSEHLLGALVSCPQSSFQNWTTSTLHKDHNPTILSCCTFPKTNAPPPAPWQSNLQQLSSLERNSQTAQSVK